MDAATLNAKIAATLDRLAQATEQARAAEAMTRYLQAMATFHSYSWGNQMLIWLNAPDATQVAGYRTWQEMGRQVRKGEKGIPILAPVAFRRKDAEGKETDETGLTFRTVYVFDVSQTDGDPLPEPPDWTSPAQDAQLAAKLTDFAQARGIAVTVEALPGQVQGQSRGGSIVLAPAAGTKTLIHELAHELMHQHFMGGLTPRDVKELQAEAVAFVVSCHFGMEPAGSPNYLALWGADGKAIRDTFAAIQRTAAEIIGAVEATPEGEAA